MHKCKVGDYVRRLNNWNSLGPLKGDIGRVVRVYWDDADPRYCALSVKYLSRTVPRTAMGNNKHLDPENNEDDRLDIVKFILQEAAHGVSE